MKIKILSVNTFMGGIVWQPLYDFLLEQKADIMLLQEVYDGGKPEFDKRFRSKQIFAEAFPDYESDFMACIGDLRQKEGLIDNGNMILTRWPIVDSSKIYFDIDYLQVDHDRTTDYSTWPAIAQCATVNLPSQKQVQLVNIHGPLWYEGGKCTDRRLKMVDSLNKLLDSRLSTIIAGDSNATPDNPCWEKLTAPHTNVFGSSLSTTFNMRRKTNPGYATASVDIFLTTPDIRIASAQCLDVDVSDHLPMVVEVEV